MKIYFGLGVLLVVLVSCSVYSGLRKRKFAYATENAAPVLQLRVPKKYARNETGTNSAGRPQQVYHYSNGALLYFVYTTDTLTLLQPIDTAAHIPRPHPFGGLSYKGVDADGRFWRELRTDSFRFGYRFVPPDAEPLFDSAVNYAGIRRFKK